MKKSLLAIGIGFLLIGSGIFTSCTKDGPMGPAGPNGTNGTNGANGTDGKDANASCLVCHTAANFDTKLAEYKLSKHFMGTSSARNTKFCARCHTNDGFQQITGNGQFVVNNDMPTASRINCETCHKHSGFDFTGDTVSMILRTTSPIYLNYNKNLTATDFGQIDNLCVTCHQIRGATSLVYSDTTLRPQVINKAFDQLPFFPFANTDDNATVNYQVGQSFAVHDGNQSNLFTGINGYEYVGKTYTRIWKHSENTCTDCHMNQFDPISNTGGHSLKVNKTPCTTCHLGDDKFTPIEARTTAKLTELAELLTARKVFKKTTNATTGAISYAAEATHDFNGKLYPTTQTAGDMFATSSSNNTVSPTTGLVIYGNILKYAKDSDYTNRIGRAWKYGELGAAYNYAYINSELSLGVHNPEYARELLQYSIDWLNANPAK
ncbi:MAG: multiheme c-type cytochrome [Bacteroidota bacterium]